MSAKLSNTKHIVHISSPLSWRGGEQQLMYLALVLRDAGLPQTIFCPEGSVLAQRCAEKGLPTTTYKKRSGTDPIAAWQLAKLLKKLENPVCHIHDSQAHTTAWLSFQLWGSKAPMVLHRRLGFQISESWLTRKKYLCPQIKRYIAISEDVANQLLAIGIPKNKIALIFDGVETQIEPANTGTLRKLLHLAPEANIVGNVAALSDQKDPLHFVRLAAQLLKSNPNLHFVWLGEGDLRAQVESAIATEKIEKNVHLLGFRTDVAAIMVDFDVFLFTSVNEGLGTSLLDAMVQQVPIVCFEVPGAREVVRPNQAEGFCVEKENDAAAIEAVLSLLNDATLRKRCIKAASERVKAFDFQKMGAETIKIYENL